MEQLGIFAALSQDNQIKALTSVAFDAAKQFGIKVRELRNISHSFNSTFQLIDDNSVKYSLRVNLNIDREKSAIKAEHKWLKEIEKIGIVKAPIPISTLDGSPSASIYSKELDYQFICTLAYWIEGEEVGDNPSNEQLFKLGQNMALLHNQTLEFKRVDFSEFPNVNTVFMDMQDNLSNSSYIDDDIEFLDLIKKAKLDSTRVFKELAEIETLQLIHADLHMGNVIDQNGELHIIDFDDAGFGHPSQDLSISIFYLRDAKDREKRFLDGYRSIKEFPNGFETSLERLLVARQLLLLNTLLVTAVADEIAFIPEYIKKVKSRLQNYYASGSFVLQ